MPLQGGLDPQRPWVARTYRAVVGFALVLGCYWLYTLLVVPLIEPPELSVAPRSLSPQEIERAQERFRRYRERLLPLFAEGTWQFAKTKIIETEEVIVLLEEYERVDDHHVRVWPCAGVIGAQVDEQTHQIRTGLVIEAPQGALLEFESSVDLRLGQIAQPKRVQLDGPVRLRHYVAGIPPEQLLSVETEDVWIEGQEVSTDGEVRFRFGRHFGKGRGLVVKLDKLSSQELSPSAASVTQFISEVRVLRIERLHIVLPSARVGASLTNDGGQGQPVAFELACDGPFRFLPQKLQVNFEGNVRGWRVGVGAEDRLRCEELILWLASDLEGENEKQPGELLGNLTSGASLWPEDAHEKSELVPSDGLRRDSLPSLGIHAESSGKGSVPGLAGWQIRQVQMRGGPATIHAPTWDFFFEGNLLEYDLASGDYFLSAEERTTVRYGGIRIVATKLRGRLPFEALGSGWSQVEAELIGPGSLSHSFRDETAPQIVAQWHGRLFIRPQDKRQVLSLVEGASIYAASIGSLSAEEVHIWLLPPEVAEPAGPSPSPVDPIQTLPMPRAQGGRDSPAETLVQIGGLRPERLLALQNVVIEVPQAEARAHELRAVFDLEDVSPERKVSGFRWRECGVIDNGLPSDFNLLSGGIGPFDRGNPQVPQPKSAGLCGPLPGEDLRSPWLTQSRRGTEPQKSQVSVEPVGKRKGEDFGTGSEGFGPEGLGVSCRDPNYLRADSPKVRKQTFFVNDMGNGTGSRASSVETSEFGRYAGDCPSFRGVSLMATGYQSEPGKILPLLTEHSSPSVSASRFDVSAFRIQVRLRARAAGLECAEALLEGNAQIVESLPLVPTDPAQRPALVTGQKVYFADPGTPYWSVLVEGHPGHVEARGIGLTAPRIALNAASNRLWVDQAGRLEIWVKPREELGLPPGPTAPAVVRWGGTMVFNGQVARFDGSVTAEVPGASLTTQELEVRLAELVPFGGGGWVAEPSVDRIHGFGPTVLTRRSDPLGPAMETKSGLEDRLEVVDLVIAWQSGDFWAKGPGRLVTRLSPRVDAAQQVFDLLPSRSLVSSASGGQASEGPARLASGASEGNASAIAGPVVVVRFVQELRGNLWQRRVRLQGHVRGIYVAKWPWDWPPEPDDPGDPPAGGTRWSSGAITAVEVAPPGGDRSWELVAEGNVRLEGQDFVARAPRASYVQHKDLLILEGTPRNPAELYRQQRPGESPAAHAATRILYWLGQRRLVVEGLQTLQVP